MNVLADGLPVEFKGKSGPGRLQCVWSQQSGACRGYCLGRAGQGEERQLDTPEPEAAAPSPQESPPVATSAP